MGVTYTLFFLTAAHDFGPVLPVIGLIEAVLLYLVFQGATWARGGLVLLFSISAIEVLFSAYESLAPTESPDTFTTGRVIAYAASCVLLLVPSVSAFMRHQRLTKLLSQADSIENDDEDDAD